MNALPTTQTPNHYDTLGADPLASLDQIEDLFRQLAVNAETSGDHTGVTQAIEAFKVLRDPTTRQQYDQQMGITPAAPAAVQQPAPASEVAVEQPVSEQAVVEAFAEEVIEEKAEVPAEVPAGVQAATSIEEPQQVVEVPVPDVQLSFEEELKLSPKILVNHRRELLKMFYEKKRKDMRASGIAIGGLDSIVPYSYELLEFHLWVLAEKKWVIREESGALSISASGCENHEQNLIDGLVQPGQ